MRGTHPGMYFTVDITDVKPGKYGYKYLLVFIDTFLDVLKLILPNMRLSMWWLRNYWKRSFPGLAFHT